MESKEMDNVVQRSKVQKMDNTYQHSKGQNSKPQEQLPNQKLPYELLLLVFSYFSIPDLVSVQRVCSGWRAAALHKSLWKKFTITLHGTPEDERQIKTMPGLRNISGYAKNSFINVILENITELCKLNLRFEPPLSSSQVETILKKYPNLESVSLCFDSPDLISCLEVLKTSKYLTELDFKTHRFYEYSNSVLMQISDVLTGSNNFPALRKTNLVNPPVHGTRFKSEAIMPAVANFISKRSDQLLSLNMKTFPLLNLRETVSKCKNVQELDLSIYGNDPSDIMIHHLTELKLLNLKFWKLDNGKDFHTFQNYFHKGSWPYLKKIHFMVGKCQSPVGRGILNAITQNVKQLEDLNYDDRECNINENELHGIGNLPKLVNLTVCGLHGISEVGMSYISSCPKLKRLVLEAKSSDINNVDFKFIRNTLRPLTDLNYFSLRVNECVDKRICIYLTGKEEIARFSSS